MSDNLNAFSMAISVAENNLEDALATAASAREHRDQIAARLQHLVDERAALASRRAGGEHHPEDAGRLGLIELDSSGLAALMVDAETVFASATAKCTEARTALNAAQASYFAEESRMALSALDDHADKLLHLLFQTLAQRDAAAAGLSFDDRAAHRMINRLKSLDALLSNELRQVRALPMRDVLYRARPNWVPTDFLYENIWRLHEGAGLFV